MESISIITWLGTCCADNLTASCSRGRTREICFSFSSWVILLCIIMTALGISTRGSLVWCVSARQSQCQKIPGHRGILPAAASLSPPGLRVRDRVMENQPFQNLGISIKWLFWTLMAVPRLSGVPSPGNSWIWLLVQWLFLCWNKLIGGTTGSGKNGRAQAQVKKLLSHLCPVPHWLTGKALLCGK